MEGRERGREVHRLSSWVRYCSDPPSGTMLDICQGLGPSVSCWAPDKLLMQLMEGLRPVSFPQKLIADASLRS